MVFKAALYEIADVLLSSVKHMSLSALVARSEKINPRSHFRPNSWETRNSSFPFTTEGGISTVQVKQVEM